MSNKFQMLKNLRQYQKELGVVQDLDKHLSKHCAYCSKDFGHGYDVPVQDFVEHLIIEHPEKIDPDKILKYKKILRMPTD